MKVFDFNIHLPCSMKNNTTQASILEEHSMHFNDLEYCFNKEFKDSNIRIDSGNFMLFNPSLFKQKSKSTFFESVNNCLDQPLFTTLIDFRNKDASSSLEIAYSQGVRGLKFHSYVQKISDEDFGAIITLSKRAEDLGMFIAIDASYGTLNIYQYDNLKLIVEIAKIVKKAHIIILHSGGARVLEAMLIADSQDNIYLESSFSLNYYVGSSIENDFAFAYKKLGSHKILYGSDYPYIDLDINIDFTLEYLQKHSFSSLEIDNIMFNNANELRQKL